MKTYHISYYLGDFYHGFSVDATNEVEAIIRVLDRLPKESANLLHDFKVERLPGEWN